MPTATSTFNNKHVQRKAAGTIYKEKHIKVIKNEKLPVKPALEVSALRTENRLLALNDSIILVDKSVKRFLQKETEISEDARTILFGSVRMDGSIRSTLSKELSDWIHSIDAINDQVTAETLTSIPRAIVTVACSATEQTCTKQFSGDAADQVATSQIVISCANELTADNLGVDATLTATDSEISTVQIVQRLVNDIHTKYVDQPKVKHITHSKPTYAAIAARSPSMVYVSLQGYSARNSRKPPEAFQRKIFRWKKTAVSVSTNKIGWMSFAAVAKMDSAKCLNK